MKKQEHLLSLNCVDTGFLALSCIKEYPHFHWVLKIDGDIDPARLNQALQAVLAEHPNLRTRACIRRMKPFRLIHEPGECKILNYIDLRRQAADDSPSRDVSEIIEEKITELHNKSVDPFVDFPVVQSRHRLHFCPDT
jgi:Condensation domain